LQSPECSSRNSPLQSPDQEFNTSDAKLCQFHLFTFSPPRLADSARMLAQYRPTRSTTLTIIRCERDNDTLKRAILKLIEGTAPYVWTEGRICNSLGCHDVDRIRVCVKELLDEHKLRTASV
jgi:hypothetical protein